MPPPAPAVPPGVPTPSPPVTVTPEIDTVPLVTSNTRLWPVPLIIVCRAPAPVIVTLLLTTICPLVKNTVNAGTVIMSPGPAAATAARSDPEPLSLPFVTATVAACADAPTRNAMATTTSNPIPNRRPTGVTLQMGMTQRNPTHPSASVSGASPRRPARTEALTDHPIPGSSDCAFETGRGQSADPYAGSRVLTHPIGRCPWLDWLIDPSPRRLRSPVDAGAPGLLPRVCPWPRSVDRPRSL